MSNKHGTDQPFMLYANEIAFVPTLKPHTPFFHHNQFETERDELSFTSNTKYPKTRNIMQILVLFLQIQRSVELKPILLL